MTNESSNHILEDNISKDSFTRLLHLNAMDNVVVALGNISDGEHLLIHNNEVIMHGKASMGHKIACKSIKKGEKIIKYGVSIGSATQDIAAGCHVHVHNMQSDYTKTHVLEETKSGEVKQ